MRKNIYIRDFKRFQAVLENWGKREKEDDAKKLGDNEEFDADAKKKQAENDKAVLKGSIKENWGSREKEEDEVDNDDGFDSDPSDKLDDVEKDVTKATMENWGSREKEEDEADSDDGFDSDPNDKLDDVEKDVTKATMESVVQRDDKYIVGGVTVTQSFINSYVKKVKDQTGQNIRQMYSDMDLAEQLIRYMIEQNADVENIPVSAILGGEEGEVEDLDLEAGESDIDTEGEINLDEPAEGEDDIVVDTEGEGDELDTEGDEDLDLGIEDEFETPEGEEDEEGAEEGEEEFGAEEGEEAGEEEEELPI